MLDELIHYGTYKSGAKDELFPGGLELSVRSTDAEDTVNAINCERYIVFEEGKQAFYRWHLSQSTGYYEEITRPYEHPGYDEWYGR